MHEIVTQLKHGMHAAGITEAELAARSGVSALTVQRILSGETSSPGLQTVADLAGVLGLRLTLAPPDQEPAAHTAPVYDRMLDYLKGIVRQWQRIACVLFCLLLGFFIWYVLYIRINIVGA